jgi:type IV secretory pathway VirB10-like protein
MAIPAGTQVLGRVASIEPLSRKRRALAIANGDFTPLRKAHLDFDTLVLKDGTRLPLHTSVSEGVPNVVHLTAGGTGKKKKKGRVRGAVEQAEQKAKDQVHQKVEQVTAPGKWDRVKAAIAAELPYRRQWLTAGTQFTAELTAALEIANSEPPPAAPDALSQLGREIPPNSLVHVSLMTAMSSATEHVGAPVRAVVSEPLFSADHHLILPAGAR